MSRSCHVSGAGKLSRASGPVWLGTPWPDPSMCPSDKPVMEDSEGPGSPPPYKMIQTIGLSVGAAVAYIIAVLGLMFYCKKRCKAKRLQKQPEGEEPEMECLNGGFPCREVGQPGTEHPPVAAVGEESQWCWSWGLELRLPLLWLQT